MQYPRAVVIYDDKLKKLLKEKASILSALPPKMEEIEKIEKQMDEIEGQIKEEERKVDISDLEVTNKEITQRFNQVNEDMQAFQKQVFARIKEHVPKELYEKYEALEKQKEQLEEERNKIALKVQKYNDRITPIAREKLSPHLADEFEDYQTIQIVGDEIQGAIYSHLEEFKTNFKKKK